MKEKAGEERAGRGLEFTVVMPCLNEEPYIRRAVRSLLDEDFLERGELVVVDGMSSDRTREIVREFIGKGYRVKLIDNPDKTQAYGLNLGIKEARGRVILRADAHCVYPPGYVRRSAGLLEETGAAAVGGMMWPVGEGLVQRAVALALRHPAGVGDARWHLGNYRGYADAAYLGVFRRRLFDEVGPYDTRCRANQDGELYLRIMKAGGRIFLDSSIRVVYFPRKSLGELGGQYFRYGKGRAYTTWKHRRLTSWRQAGPPVLVAVLLASVGLAAGTGEAAWLLAPGGYAAGLLAAAALGWRRKGAGPGKGKGADAQAAGSGTREEGVPKREAPAGGKEPRGAWERLVMEEAAGIGWKTRLLVAASWAVMHLAWGAGFLLNFARLLLRPRS